MVAVHNSLRVLHACLDDVLTADLPGGPAELLDVMRQVERARRRVAALDVLVLARLEIEHVAAECARSSTAELLTCELQVAPAEAKARVGVAVDLGPRVTLTGASLPPLLPHAFDALSVGEVSAGHVSVIRECVERLPSGCDPATVEVVESALVEAARVHHPGRVRRIAGAMLERLDPDGTRPREEEAERLRALSLTRYSDGSGRLAGRLTPEVTAACEAVIDSLSAPVPLRDGVPDPRTAAQRRHDGLAELCQRVLRSGALPATGGVPVTVIVTTTEADLRRDDGAATTVRGDRVLLSQLLASGDGELVPLVFGSDGGVLRHGRSRRLASRAQRLALTARDGGCSFPDCDRPASWCEVHHIVPWQHGGTTDLDNMTLVCRFHHREFERRDWQVRITDGRPEWIPPAWLDVQQRPRLNTAHRPPDIAFGYEGIGPPGLRGAA